MPAHLLCGLLKIHTKCGEERISVADGIFKYSSISPMSIKLGIAASTTGT